LTSTIPTQLCPTAHHWGGSIGVYNIVRTDKQNSEKVILASNLHSDQVDVERRATKLWAEHNPLEQPIRYFVDTELVGYYANNPVKEKSSPKFDKTCPVCGRPSI